MNPDNRERLYNNLINSGKVTENEIGDIEQFKSFVKDEESARRLYDNLMNSGKFDESEIGTSNQFYDFVKGDFSTPQQPQVYTPEDEKPLGPKKSAQQGERSPYQMAQGNTPTYNYGGQMPPAQRPTKSKGTSKPTQTAEAQPLGPEKFAKQMQFEQRVRQSVPSPEAMMQDFSQRMENVRKGNQPFGPNSEMRLNPDTGKMERVYYTKGGDEVATAVEQSLVNRQYDQEQKTRDDVANLSANIDSMLEAARERATEKYMNSDAVRTLTDKDKPWYKKIGAAMVTSNAPVQSAAFNTPEVQELTAAQRKLRDAKRIIAEADHNAQQGTFGDWLERSFAGGAARGFAQKATDLDTWDFGITDLLDNVSLMQALDAADKGEQLTESQQALLDATVIEMAVNTYFGSEVGRGYKAGKVTAESLPFMMEMMINPASGVGTSMGAKMTRYALKRFGKAAVKKGGKKYAARKGMEITGRVVGDALVGAPTMAATTGAVRTTADAFERMNNAKLAGEEMSFGEAFGKAFANTTIENFSEMFGAYFKPLAGATGEGLTRIATSKAGSKIGLNRVHDFIENVGASDVARLVTDFEKHARWNGVFGEYAEEVVGGVMNAIIVGDQTLDADPETGVFNLDQNIDTFLGVSLLGGFMSGVKTAGYRTPKYQARKAMSEADNVCRSAFENEDVNWDAIRATLSTGNVADVKAVLQDIATNPDYTEEQKRAVMDYASKATAYKGMLTAEQKRRASGEESDEQIASEEAFDRGYEATDVQVRHDIAMELADASLGTMSAEERQAAWDGVRQRIEDEADNNDIQQRMEWQRMQHTSDGSVRPVVLKEKDADGHDKQVYVVDGNVQMFADGTMVDPEASDHSVVIYDPATGKRRQIDPTSDMGIMLMGEPVSADEYEYNLQQSRQEYVQRMLDEAQGTVRVELGQQLTMPDGKPGVVMALSPDGESFTVVAEDGSGEVRMERSDLQQVADAASIADYQARHQEDEATVEQPTEKETDEPTAVAPGTVEGAPAEFIPDMEITILDDEGNKQPATVLGRVRYEGGQFVPDENGAAVEYIVDGEVKHDWVEPLKKKVVSHVDDTLAAQETAAEQPAAEVEQPVEEASLEAAPEGAAAEQPVAQPTEDSMPMREDGEADFLATTPQRGHRYIYDEVGLSREEAGEFVKANIAEAEKNLSKQKGKAPKMDTNLTKYLQEKAAHQQQIEQAQAVLDYWNGVKATQSAIVSAEMAEQAERDRAAHEAAVLEEAARQAEELAKREEQAALGSNAVAPQIVEKWTASPKVEGVENEITLANGEKVKGHYMLVESGAATPSHNPNMEFSRNEGFPIDENGQTVNDRDYERDQEAQRITRQMADSYDSRAIQNVPVVSQEGIVLSGNGRTMAGELAAQQGTDGAYIEHLKKYPQQFGFTPEQVEGMQHPRVVFVPDEAMPYTTETFAKFNQQDMKSQSRTEQSVKMGKTVDDSTFGRIIRSINGFDSLADFYNDPVAATNAIGELHSAGAINTMQLAEMMDGEKVSGNGRQMLENMLIGKAFESNPDAIRQLAEFPAMRQSIVSALAEIANNLHIGEDYSLESELAQAINLAYQARKNGVKAGEKVSWFARQQSLFPFDTGETVADYTNATVLMLADELNSASVNGLKKCLALYNRNAAEAAAGQYDIFSGGIKSKQDIINDALNVLNYGTEQEQQAALAAAVEQRKQGVQQDGVAGSSDAGSGVERNREDNIQPPLSSDAEVEELLARMSDIAEEMPNTTLTPETWMQTFGINNSLSTPIGNVKMGENQYNKLVEKQRTNEFGMVVRTLQSPDVILVEASESVDDAVERSTSYVFVKTFIKEDRTKVVRYESVTVSQDGMEVSISSHRLRENQLREKLKRDGLLYKATALDAPANTSAEQPTNGGSLSSGEGAIPFDGGAQTEQTPASASVTTSPVDLQGVSERKDTNNSETEQEKVVSAIKSAESEVNTNPTEGQKEAGNYKKGHLKLDGYDITIEQPKGSIRRGTDDNGKAWEQEMHNTYGYIRGTEGVDGDHIDVFLSDDPMAGNVFVVDQVNADGSFDEHKVMYGFKNEEDARNAYLSNYEDGWQGLGTITQVSKDEFKKWVESSHRKTKPFAEYASVKTNGDVLLGENQAEEYKAPAKEEGEDVIAYAQRVAETHKAYEEKQRHRQEIDDATARVADAVVSGDREAIEKASAELERLTQAEDEELHREGDGKQTVEVPYEESLAKSKGYAERLNLGDRVTVVLSADELEAEGMTLSEEQKKDKGWYNKRTGQIFVILENNTSMDDVLKTILHEGVGHHGLRELFGKHFDQFLWNVYENADESIRGEIVELSKMHGWNTETAIEEYLARLAEDENFERPELQSWWQKVKHWFLEMLHKIGFEDFNPERVITDNELRYILWRSYENLVEPDRYRSVVEEAKDIAKQWNLGVGRYEEGATTEDNRWDSEELKAAEPVSEMEPVGRSIFGDIYDQFKGKAKEALAFLKSHHDSDMVGVFNREGWGDVDLIWGDENGGAEHILSKHVGEGKSFASEDEAMETISDIIKNGDKVFENGDRAVFKAGDNQVTVRKNWREEGKKKADKNWVLTAYNEMSADSGSPAATIEDQAGKVTDKTGAKVQNNSDMAKNNSQDADILHRNGEENVAYMEKVTELLLRLASGNEASAAQKMSAYRAIGGNLASLRKAMSLQKEFDKGTVQRVTDLATSLINHGMLDNMKASEVSRLLSAVKNSTAKENIKGELNTVMDILIDSQLRRAEEMLHKLESVRGSKVDAKGVQVQGQLDIAGQRMVDTFKKARGWQKEAVEEKMADAEERMGSEDTVEAEEAALEFAGLQMALDYIEKIQASEMAEEDLYKSIRDEEKKVYTYSEEPVLDADGKPMLKKDGEPMKRTVRHTKPEFKAPMSEENKRIKQQVKEAVASTEEAIRHGKTERLQDYMELIGRLSGSMRESMANAKAWKEEQKERVREIQHNANSDMEGTPSNAHYEAKWKDKLANNSFVQFLLSPLGTFDQMLRLFGSKSANGEGYLWNRFMRGWVDSRQQEIRGVRSKFAVLDSKAKEVFGDGVKSWGDLIRRAGKLPKMTVGFWDGGEMRDHELTQGNLMYIYMVDKMSDGRMKLRHMGVTEEAVEAITKILDPRLKRLADWMQGEFLADTRKEYNETHKRMFGASMAEIEDYFPLKILANARNDNPETLDNPDMKEGISTKTGSIIKRTANTLDLDLLNADALNVILDHVAQMEHWNAYAEFNRDLNTLRTYKHFRNQVQNMTTVYGSGKELWKRFNDVCQMAAGTYRPPRAKLDTVATNMAKGVTAAKVSLRIFTALKQFLSMPAYIPDARPDLWVKNLATPWESWNWAMEKLPIFEERWKSRMAGDPRLLKTEMDWKAWRNKVVQMASKIGMSPNAFVDALTVSIGAKTIYETRKARYIKEGYGEEKAEKRAMQDAEVLYNETQQSSEGAFLSTMQVDRSWLSVMFTVFRNSSMAYQRQLHDALRNLKRDLFKKGNRKKSIEFMAKQMVREGIGEEQAMINARERYKRQMGKDALRVATFGFIVELAWNLGGMLPYLLFGDDDDKKGEMLDDVWARSMFGWGEGLTGGDVFSQAGQMLVQGEGNPEYLKKEMPITSDAYNILSKVKGGKWGEVVNDVVNLAVQIGVGVNPQSITDAVLAVMDACGNDPDLAKESLILYMRILQVPQSQIKELYLDEIDMTGEEASKLTPEQLAERYARYQMKRDRMLSPWTWDDKDVMKKKREAANKSIKERVDAIGGSKVNKAYEQYEEQYKDYDAKLKEYRSSSEYKDASQIEKAQWLTEYYKEDPQGFAVYSSFKDMDAILDKMVKYYLASSTPQEAQACHKYIEEYKQAMVDVLGAESDEERASAREKRNDCVERFYTEVGNMQKTRTKEEKMWKEYYKQMQKTTNDEYDADSMLE